MKTLLLATVTTLVISVPLLIVGAALDNRFERADTGPTIHGSSDQTIIPGYPASRLTPYLRQPHSVPVRTERLP